MRTKPRRPQRFVVSHHREKDFEGGLRSYAKYRNLGIVKATNGMVRAHVIRFLPFRGMMATPVSILGGFVSPVDALPDVGIQLAWVALMLGIARFVWRRGLARYGAFGA